MPEIVKRRRPLRKALKILACGLLLVTLIMAGLIIWLGSSSGAQFVYRQLVEILDENGLRLSAGAFEGPLPGRLFIRDAVVADDEGPLIKVGLMEVKVTLRSLIRGLVHVPVIKVENPEVIRIPAVRGQPKESSGEFSLPVGIRLDQLTVANGLIRADAFKSLGSTTPELILDAGGRARLEGESSIVDFHARLTEADGTDLAALAVILDREPGGLKRAPDQLKLSIKVHDRPGGLISALLADPEWEGLALELEGQGPLNDWRGQLDFSAAAWGTLAADLAFHGASGNLWRDVAARPDWRSRLTARLTPGPNLPDELFRLAGPEIKLDLSGALNGRNLNMDLNLDTSGAPPINLATNLTGVLSPDKSDLKLNADLSGFWPPDSALTSPINLAADVSLTEDTQALRNLKITGEGLELSCGLSHQPAKGAVDAQLNLNLADRSLLVTEGLRLAGLAPDYFSGSLNLTGRVDWPGPDEKVSGLLEIAGRNLTWPSRELTDLLGPNMDLKAELSGGGGQPYLAEINQAQAGLTSLTATGTFKPAEIQAESELSADLTASLASLTPVSPSLAGALDLTVAAKGRLNNFESLITLAGLELSSASGTLTRPVIQASAKGTLLGEPPTPGPDLSGRLELKVEDSPGGPLGLTADWRFQQKVEGMSLAVSELAGNLAGLDLAGHLNAELGAERPGLDGELTADITDWKRLAALTGQPISGNPAKIKMTLAAAEGRQAAELNLEVPDLRLGEDRQETLSLHRLNLAFKADDLFDRPDLNLNLALGPGLAGPLAWKGGEIAVDGLGGRGNFSADLKQLKMTGTGGAARDGLKLAGEYDLAAETAINLNQLNLALGSSGLSLSEPMRLTVGENLKISPFNASFRPTGQLSAEVDLTPGAMKIKADLKKLPYGFFNVFAGSELPAGEIQSLTVALDQQSGGLAGDFALKTQATPRELKNLKPIVDLTGRLSAGASPALSLEGTINGGPGWKADGKFSALVPLTPGPDGGFPQPNMNAPLKGEMQFSGPLGPLWALASQSDSSLTGMAQIQAEIGGTLDSPKPGGTIYLAGGRYEDKLMGILVRDITLEAHSTEELPLKALLSAKDSRQGGLALEAQVRDLRQPAIAVKGRLSRFSPLNRDDILVYISGDLGAEGPVDNLTLNSDLTIERGEVNLKIIQAANSISTLPISQPGDQITASGSGLRFNLKVKLPGQFFIRGDGLESEWRGEMTVGGTNRQPSIVGQLSPVRGYYAFAAKEFQFNKGEIAFNGGTMPSLNLELANQGPEIMAIIRATGVANKPKLSLESKPPLPEEEVLSYVLFGKKAASVSRFEALQLASALNDLRTFGQGGFDAIGTVRSKMGLDVLRLGGTGSDQERRASALTGSMGQEMSGTSNGANATDGDDMALEAGKYINENIYVGVEHSGASGSAVRLEVELAPSISLEAKSSTESSRVGLGWKKDY